jgi:hypothetical protein
MVVALSLGTDPFPTIFLSPPTAPSPSWLTLCQFHQQKRQSLVLLAGEWPFGQKHFLVLFPIALYQPKWALLTFLQLQLSRDTMYCSIGAMGLGVQQCFADTILFRMR